MNGSIESVFSILMANILANGVQQDLGTVNLNKPAGMVLTADGNVLIVDSGNHRVQKFTLEANISANLVVSGWRGTVQSPRGVWSR
ncbi:MAG: hypothetical protein CM1200mP35_09960 [Chloroflexota bacterium]|nr:MAG: hypothetical protein CM1200mP35_09960 [Chloroflexota bacterium]